MKVILYTDVKHVGEMGDVKNVAAGYARNYLFPRSLAVPYNAETVAYFESKKEEIEARKAQKREESKSLKEKLESLTIELTMPAGNNGKLYGAVTNLTIANWFDANGYEIERKKIEIPGATFKQVGKYTFKVHLYETTVAEVNLTIVAQKTEETAAESKASKKEAKKEEAPAAEETKSE
ncbi:50S ribosomal protein L9 [Treponema sp.]|jgi:large subunit ribosomal protein L9|uniref:50S ribosomal protein L9 n=1 Tax=Treponema sp. TaxID=166 RepID=UPI00257A305B|nr:50S ribosomal protein L9 [Treponema sp.]MBE6353884.1 50S ribosomal protein L9 [Treponema sp.]